ncbi:T9SS type A sorting domain-containing protein [Flavobacterium pectinovorum]|uniref:T9SS C-terminal target domain-containing protein n=1 Tax=Flavobacterium pectinovorum TaxID=29533 RepID=A0A502F149_9FLAO|nr:T9SS type A sorting domain-containing protein [Flavobacterium pectinovorum]TPG42161.1 T9SS C-terminal target domain-containing protein [Flavobacterium pectinovorum]
MKNNYISNFGLLKRKFILVSVFFLLMISVGQAQTISGYNPYCIASNPTYTITNPPAAGTYDQVVWLSNDAGISFSGNPSPLTLSKVVIKSGNLIAAPSAIYARFYLNGVFVIETPYFNFITPTPPTTPNYSVTKTNDYCTTQYHIITLNVTPNPNPSPNTNYSIAPRIADASIVITQTSKNIFELKLPLNGDSYFLYDLTSTTSSSGCLSNSVTVTTYGNSVPLNLTGCANNAPGTNYEFTVSPNPYSNGYITIVSSAVTPSFTGTCKVFNSSGILMTTFSLLNSSTAYALKSTVGASLTAGMYVVQVTYPNGIVKTKNLVVN